MQHGPNRRQPCRDIASGDGIDSAVDCREKEQGIAHRLAQRGEDARFAQPDVGADRQNNDRNKSGKQRAALLSLETSFDLENQPYARLIARTSSNRTTAPTNAVNNRPISPYEANPTTANSQPPRIDPTIPTTKSTSTPIPCPLTTLPAKNPARIPMRMVQNSHMCASKAEGSVQSSLGNQPGRVPRL